MTLSIEKKTPLIPCMALALAAHAVLVVPFLTTPGSTQAPATQSLAVTLAAPSDDPRPDSAAFEALDDQLGAGQNDLFEAIRTQDMGRDATAQSDSTSQAGDTVGQDTQTHAGVIARLGETAETARTPGEISLLRPAQSQERVAGTDLGVALGELDLSSEQLRGRGVEAGQRVATFKNTAAGYVKRWQQRVELIGTQRRDLYAGLNGRLRLSAVVTYQGELQHASVVESSGRVALDSAALEILYDAAPFEPFPAALTAEQTELQITRVWLFNEGLPTLQP